MRSLPSRKGGTRGRELWDLGPAWHGNLAGGPPFPNKWGPRANERTRRLPLQTVGSRCSVSPLLATQRVSVCFCAATWECAAGVGCLSTCLNAGPWVSTRPYLVTLASQAVADGLRCSVSLVSDRTPETPGPRAKLAHAHIFSGGSVCGVVQWPGRALPPSSPTDSVLLAPLKISRGSVGRGGGGPVVGRHQQNFPSSAHGPVGPGPGQRSAADGHNDNRAATHRTRATRQPVLFPDFV